MLRFYSAVVEGAVTHDGDPRLAKHIANTVTKETAEGLLIVKEWADSPRKIDLAVASVVALDRASQGVTVAPFVLDWGEER